MEQIIKELVGKKTDLYCGNAAVFRGTLEGFEDGIVRLRDESERLLHIDASKVIAVSEGDEPASRPGFIGK
mgnify:CR=1 FL=1